MSDQLPEALLDLRKWDQLSLAECAELAFQVERRLPPSFRFSGIETYSSGAEHHHIATFAWNTLVGPSLTHADFRLDPAYDFFGLTRRLDAHEDLLALPPDQQERVQKQITYLLAHQEPPYSDKQYTTTLALVPGATVTLGYDREQPILPSDELIYDAEEECLIPDSKGRRQFRYQTLQDQFQRTGEDGDDGLDIQDEESEIEEQEKLPPNYQAIAEYMEPFLLPSRTVTLRPFLLEKSYFQLRDFMNLLGVRSKSVGYSQYGGNFPITHKLATSLLEKQGFRLPTSDEWEYACQAGRKSLFFWEEKGGEPTYYPEFPPNTFGVKIARNCYDWELCMEPGILRGGDGGGALCGWGGYFMHYLTYTSAYYQMHNPAQEVGACFRRAYSL